jgi:hypothetical protein
MQATIEEALETAAEVSKTNETRFYTIQHYNDILRIHLDEIVYIHRVNRTTEIVTEKMAGPLFVSRSKIYSGSWTINGSSIRTEAVL